MSLYIKVISGTPIDHPVFAENLIQVFPDVPPERFSDLGYEPFLRLPVTPPPGHVFEKTEYQCVDGIWQDVHFYRPLSAEELAVLAENKRQSVTDWWNSRPYASNYTAWVYDETLARFVPPFPKPEDGQFYRWSGKDNNWKLAEPFPQDGKRYTFDFDNWVNVEMPTNV